MTHKFVIELVDDCKGYEQDVDYLERIYGAEHIKEYEKEIYNKAIDDAKSVILQTLDNEILVDTLHLRLEQLKAGAGNGTDNQ